MKLTPVNIKTVKDKVQEHIDELTVQLSVTLAALEVIKGFDGKQITKRIGTAVSKALPDYTVHYGKPYGWYEITIWGNDIAYGSKVSLMLEYTSRGKTLDFESVLEKNQRYTLNANRIAELEIRLPHLGDFCRRWNKILAEIDKIRAELEPQDEDLLGLVYPLSEVFRLQQDEPLKYSGRR